MPLLTSLTRSLLSAKRSRLSSLFAAADLRLTSARSRLFPPFSGDPPRSAGPLFLSSPAYQLSQSATPLHSNADFGLLAAELRKSDFCRWKAAPGKHAETGKELVGGEKVDGLAAAAPMEGFWNLPNLISLARLASGPLLGWMIVNEWYLASFFGLAISGISDWLDGFVARKMGINSVVGSYLDPLADKVLIGCVAIAMVEQNLLHPGLVLLVVTRDVGLVSAAVYRRACSLDWQWKSWSEFVNLNRLRPEKVEPLYISKVNTVLQLVLVAGALLQPVFGTEETQIYLTNLSWLVAATTVTSTVAYGVQHTRRGFVTSALGAKA